MNKKILLIVFLVVAVSAAIGAFFYLKKGNVNITSVLKPNEQKGSVAQQELISDKSIGATIYSGVAESNPAEKLPETNPFTNTKTNPLDGVYTNPFK